MTARDKDFQVRKDRILSIAIEQYIDSISPVSSSFIAKKYSFDLSSATIRNILNELEQEGYLTHPHTSAGRIPTQRGYRYYVDHLINEIQLLEEEKVQIKTEYEEESKELEKLLDRTSQVISETTHYTSIISVDGWGSKIFCRGTKYVVDYPDQRDIDKIGKILVALDEKEQLLELINRDLQKRIDVFIGQEMEFKEMQNCSLVVSQYKTKAGPSGRLAILGPTRMNYERVISTLDYFADLMEEII